MKIHCEITSVCTMGDKLQVLMQGRAENGAEWQPWLRQEVEILDTKPNRRAYYVGRSVDIELTAARSK